MNVHRVTLSKPQLDAIPESERVLLILLAHTANELNTLSKIFLFCSKLGGDTKLAEDARNAQALMLGRILAGKIYESWILLHKAFFGAQLSKSYEPEFDVNAQKAMGRLKAYFAGDNVIKTVRNRRACPIFCVRGIP